MSFPYSSSSACMAMLSFDPAFVLSLMRRNLCFLPTVFSPQKTCQPEFSLIAKSVLMHAFVCSWLQARLREERSKLEAAVNAQVLLC